jgi:RimJ/RimL family protein N-acetyltransferase
MRPEDFDSYAALWGDADVVGQSGKPLRDRRQAWELFLRNAGHWQMTGLGQWAITELRSRRMVGFVGFCFGATSYGEDFDPHPQTSWLLSCEAQSGGYGFEAIKAAHDWHDRVKPGVLVAKLRPETGDASRLLERLGYKPLRQAESGRGLRHLFVRSRAPGQ